MLEFKSEHSRSHLPLSLLEQVPRKTRQFRAVLSELLVVTNMFAFFFFSLFQIIYKLEFDLYERIC